MADEGEAKKRVAMESLGWLTESSIMPKKHRAIEGVGASSILELKAQLYKSQEDSKRDRLSRDPIYSSSSSDHHHLEVHRAKKKISAHDPYSAKNSGVEGRAAKDKLELKAIRDGAASYAALEKKAELYDKLVRGEISDEEDQEKYSVDFFRKGLEQDQRQFQGNETSAIGQQHYDDVGPVLSDARPAELGRTSGSVDRNEHKRFVMEVHEEAKLAREKASDVKMMRQEQAAARREKLKQAYLKKKLENLKASSKQEHA